MWPSAIALATEILSHPQLVRGLRVCDLGAGLGVAGIAAALAGETADSNSLTAELCS